MSVVECATCGGTGMVCPSCTARRVPGVPHRVCKSGRPKKCPNHTPRRVFCDACGADHLELLPDDAEVWWQFWYGGKVLCPACAQVWEREEQALHLVLWDALLDRLGKGHGPALYPEQARDCAEREDSAVTSSAEAGRAPSP